MQRPTFTFHSSRPKTSFLSQLQSVLLLPPVCCLLPPTKPPTMRYSALRLETLALHVVLKAGLPTDHLGQVHQAEVAAWNLFKGDYRVVGVQVRKRSNIQKSNY